MQRHLTAIVAMTPDRVIGRDGQLPWHLPEDLAFFKRTTLGHPVVMGRKTFQSLGKPLPGRRNVVVSSCFEAPGVEVISSLEQLNVDDYAPAPVWIIGGAQIYEQALPKCSDLYLSVVDLEPVGDTFFPKFEHLFRFESVVEKHEGFEVHHYLAN